MISALKKAKESCNTNIVYTLSRNNITSNAMKAEIDGIGLDRKLMENLREVDSSNKVRGHLIYSCIKAISYARQQKFKDAIKVLEKQFVSRHDRIIGKKIALQFITLFLKEYDTFENLPLLDFATFIRNKLMPELSNFKAGSIKLFYENHTFKQLSLCVAIPEDVSLHKTIHKAKGDEFENVLLLLKQEKDISFLINCDLKNNEEDRINYVAMSRARNRLFISVPTLDESLHRTLLPCFDIEVV